MYRVYPTTSVIEFASTTRTHVPAYRMNGTVVTEYQQHWVYRDIAHCSRIESSCVYLLSETLHVNRRPRPLDRATWNYFGTPSILDFVVDNLPLNFACARVEAFEFLKHLPPFGALGFFFSFFVIFLFSGLLFL